MKIKHIINFHKFATFFFVLGLMIAYQNFQLGPWVYLSLHSTYGVLWLLKDQYFPDKRWEQEASWSEGALTLVLVTLYWVAPFILISSGAEPPLPLVAIAISLTILGIFLHFGSDAQKYYTLKYHKGLITEGVFARCRNPNYLGEILIYSSFAMLSMSWIPFVILGGLIAVIFVPNMRKKDRSLSRYPEFEAYQARTGLLLPPLFNRPPRTDEQSAEA